MSFETLAALLEERGYHRDRLGALDRWYVARVLCHPRTAEGRIDVEAHEEAVQDERGPAEGWRAFYRARGWPELLVEMRVAEQMEEEARAAAEQAREGQGRPE